MKMMMMMKMINMLPLLLLLPMLLLVLPYETSTKNILLYTKKMLRPCPIIPYRSLLVDSNIDYNIQTYLAIAVACYFCDSSSGICNGRVVAVSPNIRIRIRIRICNIRSRPKVKVLSTIAL